MPDKPIDWTQPVKSKDGTTTLFVDLILTPESALDIRRMAGGLVRVELSEVKSLIDVLSQAAADLAEYGSRDR